MLGIGPEIGWDFSRGHRAFCAMLDRLARPRTMRAVKMTALSELAIRLRRIGAAAGALLVLALAILAVSPELHHALHDASNLAASEGCAIDWFAQGVDLTVAAKACLPVVAAWHAPLPCVEAELHVAAPRYLRQPERGPPSGV